ELLARLLARGSFDHRALLHPPAVPVDERVGEDLEQPRLHVRAALELVEEAEGAQEGVLHQVLGVPLVLREAQRGRIERIEVLESESFEFPAGPVGVLEIEHPAPLLFSAAGPAWPI